MFQFYRHRHRNLTNQPVVSTNLPAQSVTLVHPHTPLAQPLPAPNQFVEDNRRTITDLTDLDLTHIEDSAQILFHNSTPIKVINAVQASQSTSSASATISHPLPLSQNVKFLCDEAGCTKHYKRKWDLTEHRRLAHSKNARHKCLGFGPVLIIIIHAQSPYLSGLCSGPDQTCDGHAQPHPGRVCRMHHRDGGFCQAIRA